MLEDGLTDMVLTMLARQHLHNQPGEELVPIWTL
jgi:hypothetical protein